MLETASRRKKTGNHCERSKASNSTHHGTCVFQTAFLREKMSKQSDDDIYKNTDMYIYIFVYMSLCLFVERCRVMSCVARRSLLVVFLCVVSCRLSSVVLCSVVCVVACCCWYCCGLLLVIGVSAYAVSIAPVLSHFLAVCGIKRSSFFLSSSSPSLSLTPPCIYSKRLPVCIQNVPVSAGNNNTTTTHNNTQQHTTTTTTIIQSGEAPF